VSPRPKTSKVTEPKKGAVRQTPANMPRKSMFSEKSQTDSVKTAGRAGFSPGSNKGRLLSPKKK